MSGTSTKTAIALTTALTTASCATLDHIGVDVILDGRDGHHQQQRGGNACHGNHKHSQLQRGHDGRTRVPIQHNHGEAGSHHDHRGLGDAKFRPDKCYNGRGYNNHYNGTSIDVETENPSEHFASSAEGIKAENVELHASLAMDVDTGEYKDVNTGEPVELAYVADHDHGHTHD